MLTAALCGVVIMLLVGTAALTAAVQASHRARAAADLAALAAAGALLDPARASAPPCGVAADYAGRNSGRLLQCVVSGDTVEVAVAVDTGWRGLSTAVARARAGPSAAE